MYDWKHGRTGATVSDKPHLCEGEVVNEGGASLGEELHVHKVATTRLAQLHQGSDKLLGRDDFHPAAHARIRLDLLAKSLAAFPWTFVLSRKAEEKRK